SSKKPWDTEKSHMSENREPKAGTMPRHPAIVLRELLQSSIIHPEDWKALAGADLEAAEGCTQTVALLQLLQRHKLLTEHQAERIGNGDTFGLILGNYRVFERLGVGGMGTVYLGEHLRMRRHVAIKVMTVLPGQVPTDELRFAAEVRAVAKLDHPNIVSV